MKVGEEYQAVIPDLISNGEYELNFLVTLLYLHYCPTCIAVVI